MFLFLAVFISVLVYVFAFFFFFDCCSLKKIFVDNINDGINY